MSDTTELNERISKAIAIAVQYGGIDGSHHRAWVIDQMVRALTGCTDASASEAYRQLVRDAKAGDDGPDTYAWDVGIAP